MRNEYPRPQLVRENWLNLNGEWQFAFDNEAKGLEEHWEKVGVSLPLTIQVPFAPESELSGIRDTSRHEHVWYKRTFTVPADWDERVVLHFGAVDYRARVFVNGQMVKEHFGGHINFSVDITNALTSEWKNGEEQELTVFCSDPSYDEGIPRGKQTWTEQSHGIWYTRTSGIWQTVWLEPVAEISIDYIKMTPNIDKGVIALELNLTGRDNKVEEKLDIAYEVEISFQEQLIAKDRIYLSNFDSSTREFDVFGDKSFNGLPHGASRCWWPERPNLFDITIKLFVNDELVDSVDSYFGMRKVHTENGQLYLNNHPYYLKLVLDQGYWPKGIMTAPSDEDFIKDIEITKAHGFNGCRKHQKVEDPRFLYWADKMGFLVWGEMAANSIYSDKAAIRLQHEWVEVVKRDYNHPSIIAWVPFNESWGIPNIKDSKVQQAHTLSVYYMLKSLDPMRPVVNNDGWVMTKTDITAVHNYAHGNPDIEYEKDKVEFFKRFTQDKDLLLSTYSAGLPIYADGFEYENTPIMLTEVGGVAFKNDGKGTWGYTQAADEDAYIRQLRHVLESILASPIVSGLCYTQLSDVEQETNGLVTYDRQYKVNPQIVKDIMDKWRPNIVY